MTPQQTEFWHRFQAATGETSEKPFDIDQFGDSEAMGDDLLALVLAGTKRATCALARWYDERTHRAPRPGDLSIITDGRGRPRCVIRTTSVEIKPITQADAQFAWDEGEGDRSFEWWLSEHLKYWQREADREGFAFSTDMDAVFERFELVWAE